MTAPDPTPNRFRLSMRELLLLVMSILCAGAVELLLIGSGIPAGQATVSAAAAFAGSLFFLDRIVD